MTLWDYLDVHPWMALLHGLVLAIVIMVAMHAALGAIGIWFGTAKKLSDLEKALNFLRTEACDTERMAAVFGSVMMAMRNMDFDKKSDPTSEDKDKG